MHQAAFRDPRRGGFLKLGVPFGGVLFIRIVIFGCLYWGAPSDVDNTVASHQHPDPKRSWFSGGASELTANTCPQPIHNPEKLAPLCCCWSLSLSSLLVVPPRSRCSRARYKSGPHDIACQVAPFGTIIAFTQFCGTTVTIVTTGTEQRQEIVSSPSTLSRIVSCSAIA